MLKLVSMLSKVIPGAFNMNAEEHDAACCSPPRSSACISNPADKGKRRAQQLPHLSAGRTTNQDSERDTGRV
eukprot:3467000-Rhodomonas_salina.7